MLVEHASALVAGRRRELRETCGKLAAPTLLGLVAIAIAVPGQPSRRVLGAPQVEVAHPFTQIDDIRELKDGRVVLLDRHEGLIFLVNPDDDSVRPIGRRGRGPAEYEFPALLFPVAGGRSLLLDARFGEALTLTAEGTPGSRVALARSAGDTRLIPGVRRVTPAAADTLGGFYQRTPSVRVRRDGTEELVDSFAVIRVDLAAGQMDTVALLRENPYAVRTIVPGTGDMRVRPASPTRAFAGVDQWTVAPDGRIAVASVEPYRITYFEHGRRHDGPSLPYESLPVTQRDKDAWQERRQAPRETFVLPSGGRSMTRIMARGPGANSPVEWPARFPPFLDDALQFAPDGRLWIRRASPEAVAPSYDVVDRQGRVVEHVVLPVGSWIVGFGTKSIYAVRIDGDGLHYLRRYAF